MKDQIKFVLGWAKYNKFIITVFLSVLSLIVCSNILLVQFFYESCVKTKDGKFYYTYYFDESVSIDVVDEMLKDMNDNNVNVLEFLAASNSNGVYGCNEYQISSYLILDAQENEERNQYLSYGKFDDAPQSYISDMGVDDLVLDGLPFECAGEGAIHVGSYFSDYMIGAGDYRNYIHSVDALEITLTEKNGKALEKVIRNYTANYEVEQFEELLESGFESIKGTIVICFLLFLFSLYSALVFVEIIMHMQSLDIAVLRRCGATKPDIRRIYLVQVIGAGAISFVIGAVLCNLLLMVTDFNFHKIEAVTYLITFLTFMLCYIIEALIYIRATLNYTGSMISREC
ncbi:MAG: hypothetical protein NC225_07500 [Clostridium sp.]|nr:hypothetical protein [Clostridium sp.]MCM1460767.1 hypothetical protein [Bacteroides sp.]